MNTESNTNMRNENSGMSLEKGTQNLRALSLALFGLALPTTAQATIQSAPEASVQIPAELQALKDAVFNMGRQYETVGDLVKGNTARIHSAEAVAEQQRGRQKQIGEDIAQAYETTNSLSIRATSLEATAGLAAEVSQLRAIPPTCFSYGWYLTKYPDVAATGALVDNKTGRIKSCDENFILAIRHYHQHGRAEGRSPNPLFFPSYYCEHYPDVAKSCPSGMALYEWALQHWQSVGAAEGRQGSPLLCPKYYLEQNPDLQNVIGDDYLLAMTHFVHHGLSELRAGSSEEEALIRAKFPGVSREALRVGASVSSLDPGAILGFVGALGDLLDYPDSCADALDDNLKCLQGGFVGCVVDWVQASQVCLKEDFQKAIEHEAAIKELKEMADKMERDGGTKGWDKDIDKQNAAGERHEREAGSGRMNA